MKMLVAALCLLISSCSISPNSCFSPQAPGKIVPPVIQSDTNKFFQNLQDATPQIRSNTTTGSGIVIFQDQQFSYILTDRHVIDCDFDFPKNVQIFPTLRPLGLEWEAETGEPVDGEVLAISDLIYDLALIRSTHHFRHVVTFTPKLPFVGTPVYVAGCPKGGPVMITHGIVTRFDIHWKKECLFINSDCLTTIGMSGGGMYLQDGTCVGITQLIFYSQQGVGNFHASLSGATVKSWLNSVGYGKLMTP